jgi:hypothetical protein
MRPTRVCVTVILDAKVLIRRFLCSQIQPFKAIGPGRVRDADRGPLFADPARHARQLFPGRVDGGEPYGARRQGAVQPIMIMGYTRQSALVHGWHTV